MYLSRAIFVHYTVHRTICLVLYLYEFQSPNIKYYFYLFLSIALCLSFAIEAYSFYKLKYALHPRCLRRVVHVRGSLEPGAKLNRPNLLRPRELNSVKELTPLSPLVMPPWPVTIRRTEIRTHLVPLRVQILKTIIIIITYIQN